MRTASAPAGMPSMRPGQVHVWRGRRGDASAPLASLLDEVERARSARYRRDEDRERFLVGCALAKLGIARWLGCDAAEVRISRTCSACGEPHGKPMLARPRGSRVELSVSHSGDLVVVAFASGAPVGVDVERLDPGRPTGALAGEALADEEAAALSSLPPGGRARGFLVSWTRKEAVTKAAGEGLRLPLRDVVVSGFEDEPRLVRWPLAVAPETVAVVDLHLPRGYIGAVAVMGACDAVIDFDASDLLRASSERISGTRRAALRP